MEEEICREDFPSNIFSMNDFLKEFQKLSKDENSEILYYPISVHF